MRAKFLFCLNHAEFGVALVGSCFWGLFWVHNASLELAVDLGVLPGVDTLGLGHCSHSGSRVHKRIFWNYTDH